MSTLTNTEYSGSGLIGVKHPWQPDWIKIKKMSYFSRTIGWYRAW